MRQRVRLADGSDFVFADYLRAQRAGTQWLRDTMEWRTGMASYVEAWQLAHRPHKRHPERTLKSFCFQEAESFSRDAKVAELTRRLALLSGKAGYS